MKRYESNYNPAVKELSDYIHDRANDGGIHPDVLSRITNVLEGVKRTDEMIFQKEQLLVQKERELDRLKSITDNSSKVARNIVNESKGNLDKATELLNSGNFNEALKYSDRALYNLEDIDNLGLQTLAQANNLYLERKQQYVEAAAKRDDFYNQGVINGVNAFSWVKDNPTRDFYTFFREILKVSDKSPENVNLINNRLYHNLPKYLQEAQRANHFYNEYNKYYDAMTKLEQVVNILNIKAASSKGLKNYEEALRSCDIALEIEPTNATLLNLKNAISQEKHTEEASKLEEEHLRIEKEQELKSLNDTLLTKEEQLSLKENHIGEISQKIKKTNRKLAAKDKEIEALKVLLAQKDTEIQNKELLVGHKDELLAQKEIEAQELLAQKELEKQELLIQKEREKEELLALKENELLGQKNEEIQNKSAEKNRIIEELASNLLTKEEVIAKEKLKNAEVSQSVKEANRNLAAKDTLLSDKNQEIEVLKALIEQNRIEKEELVTQQELAVANKSHMKNQIIDGLREEVNLKENEVVDLRIQNLEKELMTQEQGKLLIQKDIELENLFDQKDEAVRNKSFAKNQIISGLREAMTEKEKEAYQLQIESLMKQVELHKKEAEDARIISELKGQLLTLKALYGNDVSFSEEFSAIQFRAENSIENRDFGDIQDLARHIGELIDAERENSEPMSLATLMALNESPITHGEEQPIYRSISCQPGESLAERQMESLNISSIGRQNQVVQTGGSLIAGEQMSVPLNQGNIMNHGAQNQNLIGNFDIGNQHTTHSVVLGGESSDSFSIIDAENSH